MSLLRAQWKKATGNLLLAGFPVLIVPIGLLTSYILASLIIGAGQAAGHAILGLDYGSILGGDELALFAESYFEHLLLGALSLLILAGFTAEPVLVISLIALALWAIVPVAISIFLFNRQDITS